MNDDLKKYVQAALAKKFSKEDIYTNLINNDWSTGEIDAVFSELEPDFEPIPTLLPKPTPAAEPEPATETKSAPNPAVQGSSKRRQVIGSLIGICLLILVVGGTALAYVFKVFPFDVKLPYREDNLVSGILVSLANMKTATYSISGQLEMEEREPDAVPFVLEPSPERKLFKEKYARDKQRIETVSLILSQLSYSETPLESLAMMNNQTDVYGYSLLQSLSTKDPLTGLEYDYHVTGDDFQLQVKFETQDALDAIRSGYYYDAASTIINSTDLTVTFTKASPSYLPLSSEPPKPYFEQLNDMMVYLPPELSLAVSMEAATDFTKENSDWSVALDANGDFGDLVYRAAGDILRKDKDLYLRVRNMPSLLAGLFPFEKGTWIKVPPGWFENSDNYSSYSFPGPIVPTPGEEEEYKQRREEASKFAVAVIKIADEEKVLMVKNEPRKEEINGQMLYRYELAFNKDKILPFVQRVTAEAQRYETTRDYDLTNDTALVEYLQSEEFSAVFDYYNKNTSLTLWVNKEGFIDSVEYSLRAVPDAQATILQDKQARLTIRVGFKDINQPVEIIAPTEYKSIDDVMKAIQERFSSVGFADDSQSMEIKQEVANFRSNAETFYSNNNNSYGRLCESEEMLWLLDTVREIKTGLSSEEITMQDSSMMDVGVSCQAGETWYVLQAPLTVTDAEIFGLWCVDSTGYSGGLSSPLPSTAESCVQ